MKHLAALLFTLLLTTSLPAHPGGLTKDGCHTCKKNCAKWELQIGEYHCHKKLKASESEESPKPKPKPKKRKKAPRS